MRQLVEDGRVERGFLGVTLDGSYDSRLMGALVKSVMASSPADEADLQADDVILRFNGTPVVNSTHLQSLVNLTEAGSEVELTVMRRGERMRKQVYIGRKQAEPAQ